MTGTTGGHWRGSRDGTPGHSSTVRRSPALWLALALGLLLGSLLPAAASASPAGSGLEVAHPLVAAPKITKSPDAVAVLEGQPASFSGSATGAPTAQWEISTNAGVSWQQIPGATSNTYTIASTTASENGNEFRVVFTNAAGSVTSRGAALTVENPPLITLQPVNATAEEGHTVIFDSTASGTPSPKVQWQRSTNGGGSWTNISGATSTTLELTGVTNLQTGFQYRAIFSNAAGEVTSSVATMTVQEPPKITKQPSSLTVEQGEAAIFESTASSFPASAVQWEVSANQGASWTPVAEATTTKLTVPATVASESGNEYRATFTNPAGTLSSSAATLTVQATAVVTLNPVSAIVLQGASTSFEAAANGTPAPTVQWQVSSNSGASWANVAGATSDRLTISDAQLTENGHLFRAVFTNNVGSVETSSAMLTVSATDYSAYGWGMNTHGQVGIGSTEAAIPSPMPITPLHFVSAVAAGSRHSLALLANGTVDSWGFNAHGQLGVEGSLGTRVPIAIPGLSGVTAIAAGGSHSLALLANGTVMAWGDDENGQLGNGKLKDSEVPVPVSGLAGVVAIAAGEEDSMALLSNGTVKAWGNDERGQLGIGKTSLSDTPVAVKGLTGVKAIAAGSEFSMALLENGTVMAWGDDEHDQLANRVVLEETATQEEGESPREEGALSTVPVPVENLSGVSAIAAGHTHALALLSGGTVMAWGNDSEGELGNGQSEPANDVPAAVSGLSGVRQISAGDEDSVALLSSGALMSWGSDNDGGLGDGLNGPQSDVPVSVAGIGEATAVAAGASHMLALGEPLPSVSAISPHLGAAAGGTRVTIEGSDLAGAESVHFAGAPASDVTIESPSRISATSPAGSGTVDVTVTTPAGTSPVSSADRFTYRVAPTLTKLSAKGGPASGGTSVTLTGTELSSATVVEFAGVPATNLVINSNTSVTVTTPANVSGIVNVTVTAVGGTSAITKKTVFKYTPVVSGLSPSTGPLAGTNPVQVSGYGFAPGNSDKFKFGKGVVKTVECSSTTSCTVTVPVSKTAGAVIVAVTANKANSVASAGDEYTYE